MSLNELDALGSILSGVASVLGLVGILFAANEIRRSRLIADRETDYRIYEMMLDLDRFFFDNPGIRPYIYDSKELSADLAASSEEYIRVMAAAEMMIDFMECTFTQFPLMPVHQRVGWILYMKGIGESSPVIRHFVTEDTDWYMASFVHLLVHGEYDPRLDVDTTREDWRRLNVAHWRNRLNRRLGRV